MNNVEIQEYKKKMLVDYLVENNYNREDAEI
jgi:hypothetical protein